MIIPLRISQTRVILQEMCAHPAWIEVDLDQFAVNIARVREAIGSSLLCLPVKANAYGHGLVQIGLAAQELGVDYLGVAHLQEGIALREAGVQLPILVFGAIHEDQIGPLIQYELEFSISSIFKADLVAKQAQGRCRVHLEVDTGMQRTGVRVETAPALMQRLVDSACFDVVGVYSHFASSDCAEDPFTHKQLNSFLSLKNHPLFQKEELIWHIANSGGVAHYPSSHLNMVRPSGLIFGCTSFLLEGMASCFSLKARVSYFKVVEPGQGVSYKHTYVTPKRTRLVTVPVGYGDGYRRALSNRSQVLIGGKRFPIVGTICMDQFMVDVGDERVCVGDEVVLIGRQGEESISLNEIADLSGTISYEVLCNLNNRLPRTYQRAHSLEQARS